MTVGDRVSRQDQGYENVDELEIRYVKLCLHGQEVIRTVWH